MLRVSAVDYDEDQTVTFTLVGGDTDVLSIDSQGTVRTADGLDREVQDMHSVIVRATDNAGHTGKETPYTRAETIYQEDRLQVPY